MDQVVQMPLSFFIEEDSNGNAAMPNLIKKVDEASKLLKPGVVIELDNGVRCSSRDELLLAISQAGRVGNGAVKQYLTQQMMNSTSNEAGKKSPSNIALWAILVVLLLFVILFIIAFTGGF